jgi:ligand-binding SRPBCC domain-containing protein
MTLIVIETRIAAPPDLCFDLARDVEAHAESAAFSGERVTKPGRTAGLLELGDLVTFEGRHFGMRQRATARITYLDRPRRFDDELVRSAFVWLHHRHEFEAVPAGTLMRDTLEWRSPAGILGVLADKLLVTRHMRRFVTHKQRQLKRIAEERVNDRSHTGQTLLI